ncbi:MAG: autotransporter domain-containing protein [Verrucomicrobia bacterium]|nr:autotransporter domain-containing protein [Verrucomicrobiota bacterium]
MKIRSASCDTHSLPRPIRGAGILLPILLLAASVLTVQRASAQAVNLYVGSNSTVAPTNFTSGTNPYDNTYVGYTTNASNNLLTVGNSNTLLTNSSDLHVGYYGSSNSLVISNGGHVVVDGNIFAGRWASSSNNSLVVTGTSSLLTNSGPYFNIGQRGSENSLLVTDGAKVVSSSTGADSFNIGYFGSSNSLVISHGGSVSDYFGNVGFDSTSTGNSAIVTGSNSTWSNNRLTIGHYGQNNSLLVSNGGTVLVGDYFGVGAYEAGANSNTAVITGSGSSLRVGSEIDVGGENSYGSKLTVCDGAIVTSSTTYIGAFDTPGYYSSNNAVLITGGAAWTNSGSFYIGQSGSMNSLVISNAGLLVNAGDSIIGDNITANNNSVLVTGVGSLWTNSGDISVGFYGSANSLVISNGGVVSNANPSPSPEPRSTIGYQGTSSNNWVLVTGTNSLWEADIFQVGINGSSSNSLVISEGGHVIASILYTGGDAGASNNSVIVTGSDALLSVHYDAVIGADEGFNSLVISNGGMVANGFGYIGLNTNSSNNSVLVTGTNSLWTNSGDLYVGYDGSGNSLVISNGGRVANVSGYVGFTSNAVGNSVTVDGSNSSWINSGDLYIGYAGQSNRLVISNGGYVSNVNGFDDGTSPTDAFNSVLVTGFASRWINSENLTFGLAGHDNALVISNGGVVTVGSNSVIGDQVTASNNSVLVTGSNSLWSNSGYLYVGENGSGNSLVISGGGVVADGWGYIGGTTYSSNNSVLVTESNSLWTNNSDLYVGEYGSGNSLVISNGGSVANGDGYVGFTSNAVGNSVTVDGSHSSWINSGDLYVGFGGQSNRLVISNGAQVADNNGWIGYLNTSSNNSVTVNGGLWSNSGSLCVGTYGTGTLTIANGGSLIAPSITIAQSGGSIGILNIGSLNGTDGAGTITATTINFGSGSGTLNFNQIDSVTISSYIRSSPAGNGAINQLGTGTTTLSGNNTFTGDIMITRGTLVAANTNALGASDVTLGGTANTATLALATNLTITTVGPPHYDLTWGSNGVIALAQGTHALTLAGGMTNAAGTNAGANAFLFLNTSLNNNTNTLIYFGTPSSGFTTNSFSVQGIQGYSFELTSNHVASYISTTANLVTFTNIILNNTLTVTSLTVAPAGSLSGIGTLNGNLTNGGSFTPGNAGAGTGVFTLNGNFTQTGSGAFILQASSGGEYNKMQVNGSVLLGGTLVVTGVNGYALNFGDKYTFITSTGPIKGEFSSIETPAGYRARLEIIGDPQAVILVAPVSYTQLSQNPNQNQVATVLDSYIPATSGDRLVISTSLDSLTASQYAQAFNAIMPTMYQSMATIAFNQANAINMQLNQRLWGLRIAEGGGFSMNGFGDNTPMLEGQGDGAGKGVLDSKKDILRPGADNHWGMFVDGNGIFAQANSGNMLPGYNSESGGVTTGLTYKWNESFASGLYCGYEGTYAKMGANGSGLGTGSSLIDNAVRFGVFGTYGQKDGKGFYGSALAGGAYHNYQATRVIQYTGMNRTANSSPGAGELDTMLATGYDIQKGKFTFGPTASLQYTYLGVNALNETGAQSLDFNSGGWNSSSMLSSVGAHAAYNWQAGRNVVVVPQVNLSWQHEFLQNPYDISGNLGGTSPNFSNTSATGIRDYLYTGVGFTLELGKKWNTAFFYNAAAGNNNLTSQNIFWSAGVKF